MKKCVAVLMPEIIVQKKEFSPLEHACQTKDVTEFLSLLKQASINDVCNDKNEYPIHLASKFTEANRPLSLALEMGANPNVQTKAAETPLHYCVAMGNGVGLESLLAIDVSTNPYLLDCEGRTPFRLACEMMGSQRPDGVPMVKQLLRHGLVHESVNRHNDTLTIAFFAYMNGSAEALQLVDDHMLYPGIDHIHPLRVTDFCNDAVLKKYSEQVGEKRFVKTLIDFSTDANQTVFHHVANRGYISGLKIILDLCRKYETDYDAALNQIDHYRCRPIHYAAQANSPELLKILLESGASLEAYETVDNPIFVALSAGKPENFNVLLAPTLAKSMPQSYILAKAQQSWTFHIERAKGSCRTDLALASLFAENPKEFKSIRVMIGISKSALPDTTKNDLHNCRQLLDGIKKIILYLEKH
jgi:ankyrin repeat protein